MTNGKLVADFLYGAKRRAEDKRHWGFRPVPFNPKARDISEVMSAVENEVLLPDGFAAPCWLPDGEAATDWIVCRNGIVNVRGSMSFSSIPIPFGRIVRSGGIGSRMRRALRSTRISKAAFRAIPMHIAPPRNGLGIA